MNSSRTSKRRVRRQLTVGLLTAGFLSAALAAPAYAVGVNEVTPFAPINLAGQSTLVISGTADSAVAAVTVSIDDEDPATPTIVATVAPLAGGAGQQSWSTAAVDVTSLTDGLIFVTSTYDGVPAANDPITSKDTVPPEIPTVFPQDGATFAAPTDINIVSLDPADSTFFTFGTPTAADPTSADATVPAQPLPSHTVSTTEQVKAIAIDPAGNPSPIMVANYTVGVPAPTATTTTLALSPASPQVAGTPVNLSASVTPAATPGTFEFFDGPTSLGTAAALGGTATKSVPTPTPGTHSFTATFTPTNIAAFTPSTSGAAAFTITAPSAATTSTTLALTPASTQLAGTPLLLSATVNPTTTPGTFEFFDGPASMGAGSATATMNVTPAAGTHSFTAKFTPTDSAAFSGSTSTAVAITITTPVIAPPPPPVIAPKVISRTPAAGATGVSRVNNILAVFSKNVTGVSARSFTLRTRSGATVPSQVTYNPTTRMAMLNPIRTLAADTSYVATLGSAISAGKSLAVTTWAFTTGPRPTMAARTPGVNAKHVARNANVTLRFSEKVSGVSGSSLTLVTTTGRRVAAVVSYNRTTKVATLNPVRALSARTRYTVRVTSAIKDRAANPLTATRWSFTTA